MSIAERFQLQYGGRPDGVFSAPGRVNLIGEHTDYNNGLVLPFAIDARAQVAVRRIDEPVIRVVSVQREGAVIEAPLSVLRPGTAAATGWPAYLLGTAWALIEAGIDVPGAELALDSAVPVGAGLSSSAAVECATALALSTIAEVRLTPADLARLAQRAENAFVGVPTGLMDQMASAGCRAGHLLFFDVGAGTTENIPFDPAANGLQVLVIDTGVHHSLADGEYAKRRASCEWAAELLGLNTLRDITDAGEALARLGSPASGLPAADRELLVRRVRHVLSENGRVFDVVQRLRAGDIAGIGADLTESHISMRDDYEISSIELDTAVDAALGAGALGARMTGGGFGGSAIALVPSQDAARVAEAVDRAFAAAGFAAPTSRHFTPADGARRES
ncbi:galactokinase [Nakamurella lactea]|uniref:galactokinase n=1 Tax=Nakamurella lactea TaxID=459515 RepID=UPI000424F657|nr:galactokinase [Nakamurella lactea]